MVYQKFAELRKDYQKREDLPESGLDQITLADECILHLSNNNSLKNNQILSRLPTNISTTCLINSLKNKKNISEKKKIINTLRENSYTKRYLITSLVNPEICDYVKDILVEKGLNEETLLIMQDLYKKDCYQKGIYEVIKELRKVPEFKRYNVEFKAPENKVVKKNAAKKNNKNIGLKQVKKVFGIRDNLSRTTSQRTVA